MCTAEQEAWECWKEACLPPIGAAATAGRSLEACSSRSPELAGPALSAWTLWLLLGPLLATEP